MRIDFRGKDAIYNYHLTVPLSPLVVQEELSLGEPSLGGDLIIHGDNLRALKALMPHYGGKIDCVFIDPPYNTGNENWRYNDAVNNHSEFWCDLKVSFLPGSVEYSVAKLTKSNAYIRTKEQRKDAIARSVISSSACEGVTVQRTDLPLNGRRSQEPSPPTPPKG